MVQNNYPCGGSEDSKLDLLTHSVCKIKLQINYTIKYEKQDFKIRQNTEICLTASS